MNTQIYKNALLEKSNELRQSQVSKDEIAIERNAELLDEVQRTSDREIAMTSMTIGWQSRVLVAEALNRIATGEFGICAECEQPISERRLNAIPWAKFCIRCQEAADQRNTPTEFAEAA